MTFTFVATPKLPATAITYTVLSGTLPSGLTLNSTTGVLSGTPAIVGSDTTYNFAVRATDDYIGDEQRIADRTFNMNHQWSCYPYIYYSNRYYFKYK